jgi:probable phosphoglycerate mutase
MIYLLRHGQTEFNAAGRYQGRIDSALNAKGLAQAGSMGAMMATLVDPAHTVILSSPLARAARTAEIVGEAFGLPTTLDPRLTEVSMGDWEGLTAHQIDTGWPGVRDSFPRNGWFFGAPGGETLAQVTARVTSLLVDAQSHAKPNRILVSHAITGRILRGIFADLPPERAFRLEIPQDAVFRLHGNGQIERISAV